MTSFDKFIQPDMTITIEMHGSSYELDYRGPSSAKHAIPLPITGNQNQIKESLIPLRDGLSEWAKKYDSLLADFKTETTEESKEKNEAAANAERLDCDPERIKEMWADLAAKGRSLYQKVFGLYENEIDENLKVLRNALRNLEHGSILELDTMDAPLPWGLLYDGTIPSTSDPDYFEKLWPHFWGLRYQLISHAPYGQVVNNKPYLVNSKGTRLLIGINVLSDTEYKTHQVSFFNRVLEQFENLSDQENIYRLKLGKNKTEVISNLSQREEPQHLYYLFCHHQIGGAENQYGITDYLQRTQIAMEGEQGGVITLEELQGLLGDKKIVPFEAPPVVFLNACHSNQLKMGDPTSFMSYFITGLRSWNFVGTEADMPAPFADWFGQDFVKSFLAGSRVGEVLFDLKNYYARQYHNPFGLYYTLFGRGDIYLESPVTVN